MKVLCKRATIRLIKGATYDVLSLHNSSTRSNSHRSGTRQPPKSGYLRLKQGRFVVSGFTKLDGSPLDEIEWESDEFKEMEISKKDDYKNTIIEDVRKLKKGDIVICRYKTKLFDEGKKYKIEEVFYKEAPSKWNALVMQKDQKIKIQGHGRWMHTYRFRLCTPQEKRVMSLNDIFDENTTDVIDMKDIKGTRKILRLTEKDRNKVILSSLLYSIIDPYRNNLSTIEWAVEKKGKQYDLIMNDLKPFLNKKLSDIIKMCD